MATKNTLNKVAAILLTWWVTPVFRYGVKDGKIFAEIFPALNEEGSIDERIQKIDEARDSLCSALTAIDELKEEATLNKREAYELQNLIAKLSSEKVAVNSELEKLRRITESDVDVFQRLAGVPSQKQIAKERLVGFVLGIIGSLLATLLWEKWHKLAMWFTVQ